MKKTLLSSQKYLQFEFELIKFELRKQCTVQKLRKRSKQMQMTQKYSKSKFKE